MNKDADEYAQWLADNGDFLEEADGDYDACPNFYHIKLAILDAMEWAYRDCLRIVAEERADWDETLYDNGAAFDATSSISSVIEARLK